MMLALPVDLLALLPLDRTSLARLACTCTGLRDAVAEVECIRGVTVAETRMARLAHPRYEPLTSLCVVGPSQPWSTLPSPVPVPQPMPYLRTLRLHNCRPQSAEFWDAVLDRAPKLAELAVCPVFYGVNYEAILTSCADMMRLLTDLRGLTRLELRGSGLVLWGRRCCDTTTAMGKAFAAGAAMASMPIVRLPELRELVVTGQQLCPAVDASLRSAILEEPNDACMLDRLGPAARLALEDLDWSAPAHRLVQPTTLTTLTNLRTLDVTARGIRTPAAFDDVLRSLSHVPPGLTCLTVRLDFSRMSGEDPTLRYDVAPLSHLARLTRIEVQVSFATRGCGALLTGLLGLPQTVARATVRAEDGPAESLRDAWNAWCADDADPEGPEMMELAAEIAQLERACQLPGDVVRRASHNFPHTAFEILGFHHMP